MQDPNNQQPTGQGDQADQNQLNTDDKSIFLPRIDQTMVLPNAIKPRHLLSAGINSAGSVPMSDGTTFQAGNLAFVSPHISGAKYVKIWGSGIPIGDTDLYTVPLNKKCIIFGGTTTSFGTFFNTGNTVNFFPEIKINGVYYRLKSTTTIGIGGQIIQDFVRGTIILNAGESISINVATNAGLNMWAAGIEFASTVTTIKTARILNLVNGDNTIYTVPANKSAVCVSPFQPAGIGGALCITNASGGSLTYTPYLVPAGGVSAQSNQFSVLSSISNGATSSYAWHGTMKTGDSIVLNTSSGNTGQTVWTTVFEI